MNVGRFAPSPSGPLHFGSLIAALGSFLCARKAGGRWLLRIEDVDGPRVVPGATDEILGALDAYQLHWDGRVVYQSSRTELYRAALLKLTETGQVFACACSRRQISEIAANGPAGCIYPGTCRRAGLQWSGHAIRVLTESARVNFEDRVQGSMEQDLRQDIGDFVVRRADGTFAYQLAVVVDDSDQGVTDIVRGHDILDSTGRQIHLQRLLGLPTPGYAHLPLAVDAEGQKLSKMSGARPISLEHAGATLFRALEFLGQCPPRVLEGAKPSEVVAWAIEHWEETRIPARPGITTHDMA